MTFYYKTVNEKNFEELFFLFAPLDIKTDDAFKYEVLLDNGLYIKVTAENVNIDDKFTYFVKNKALNGFILENYLLIQNEEKLLLFQKDDKSGILSELKVHERVRTTKKFIAVQNRREIHIYTIQK